MARTNFSADRVRNIVRFGTRIVFRRSSTVHYEIADSTATVAVDSAVVPREHNPESPEFHRHNNNTVLIVNNYCLLLPIRH